MGDASRVGRDCSKGRKRTGSHANGLGVSSPESARAISFLICAHRPPIPRPAGPNFVAGSLVPTPAPGILPPNPALAAAAARLPITTASALPARPNLPDDPVIPINGFATHDEAEKAFVHLLKKAGVDPTWTWDATMRAIITDPLYKALGTLAEKKAAWQKVRPHSRLIFSSCL